MKAVILVGGKATRLLPLTYNIPKAIVPVLNTPFLEHVIRHLAQHHVKEIILAQGHLAQPTRWLLGDGRQLGVKLNYVVEDTPLGTAGAVKNAQEYLDEPFVVLNGDTFTDLDITAMVAFHRKRRAKITMALTHVDDPTSYGLIESTQEGRVTRFLEKPRWEEVTTNWVNAGTYILEPDVLTQIPSGTEVSFEHEIFPRLLSQGTPIYAYLSSAYWLDIGTPGRYLQLHRDLLSGKYRHYTPTLDRVLVGKQCEIHPTAQITGPVIIGTNCSIGRQARLIGPVVIGAGCRIMEEGVIESSVIWQNTWLEPQVKLRNSIVADNCHFEAGSVGEEIVVGENVTVARDCRLEPGSRILPETTVPAKRLDSPLLIVINPP